MTEVLSKREQLRLLQEEMAQGEAVTQQAVVTLLTGVEVQKFLEQVVALKEETIPEGLLDRALTNILRACESTLKAASIPKASQSPPLNTPQPLLQVPTPEVGGENGTV